MAKRPTHFDARGRARMVDVGDKADSDRKAVARGRLALSAAGWKALSAGADAKKGDALGVAQIAAIQGAKRTSEWIPLAHPLALDGVTVDWRRRARARILEIEVTVRVHGPTGVEMEALCGASAGLLTVYDMLKAVDRSMRIGPIWLAHKSGGRSGSVDFEDPPLA